MGIKRKMRIKNARKLLKSKRCCETTEKFSLTVLRTVLRSRKADSGQK
jgi:hypothetical protein